MSVKLYIFSLIVSNLKKKFSTSRHTCHHCDFCFLFLFIFAPATRNYMENKKLIDVKEVLKQKAPAIATKIPAFAINYLIRTVHQDDINDIIRRLGHLDGVAFMQALVKEFDVTLHIIGEENLPPSGGRYIFAANHPLGALDGVSLAAFLGEKYQEKIRYLVNDILLYIPNLQSIFIPINKHGTQGKDAARKIEEAFTSDNQILTFPSGFCSRKIKGAVMDLPWKKSFIQKAIEHQRDIVPIHFGGRNSNFFYRLANIRTRLGLKMNYEMLYLPDESFKNKHQTFTVHIGKPIPWETFDKTKTHKEWALWIQKKVYDMSQK